MRHTSNRYVRYEQYDPYSDYITAPGDGWGDPNKAQRDPQAVYEERVADDAEGDGRS